MTLHSDAEFTCLNCTAVFIPYRRGIRCPNCGQYISDDEVDLDFIDTCRRSLEYNLEVFRTFTSPAWIPGSVGDCVIWHVGCVMDSFRQDWLTLTYSEINQRLQAIAKREDNASVFMNWLANYVPDSDADLPDLPEVAPWWWGYIKQLAAELYVVIHRDNRELELLSIGQTLYEEDHHDVARRVFRDIFHMNPSYFPAWEAAIDVTVDLWGGNPEDYHLKNALRDFRDASHRHSEHPDMPGMLADGAYVALQPKKYEQAAFLYEKAIAVHDGALMSFQGEHPITKATKVFKVDVVKSVRAELRGLGRHPRRLIIGEHTLSDLHVGCARAYEELLEYNQAVTHYRIAADHVFTSAHLRYLHGLRLPFKVGVFGNDSAEFLEAAERARLKMNRRKQPTRSLWARLFGQIT